MSAFLRLITKTSSLLGLTLVSSAILWSVSTASSQDMLIYTANWCAGCREVMPIVENIARSQGHNLIVIDVDQADAPKRSQSFGLEIPQRELPQVFAITRKTSPVLLYDGSQHLWGQPEAVQARITSRLMQAK